MLSRAEAAGRASPDRANGDIYGLHGAEVSACYCKDSVVLYIRVIVMDAKYLAFALVIDAYVTTELFKSQDIPTLEHSFQRL